MVRVRFEFKSYVAQNLDVERDAVGRPMTSETEVRELTFSPVMPGYGDGTSRAEGNLVIHTGDPSVWGQFELGKVYIFEVWKPA